MGKGKEGRGGGGRGGGGGLVMGCESGRSKPAIQGARKRQELVTLTGVTGVMSLGSGNGGVELRRELRSWELGKLLL